MLAVFALLAHVGSWPAYLDHSACRLCLASIEEGRVDPSVRRAAELGLFGTGELVGPAEMNDGGLKGVVVRGEDRLAVLLSRRAACGSKGVDWLLRCLAAGSTERAGLAPCALAADATEGDAESPIL